MTSNTCTVCKRLVPYGRSRCEAHKRTRRHALSASARGYDAAHRAARQEWGVRIAQGGVRCIRLACGQPILPGDLWDLGHPSWHNGYRYGPEHRKCNRGAPTRRAP